MTNISSYARGTCVLTGVSVISNETVTSGLVSHAPSVSRGNLRMLEVVTSAERITCQTKRGYLKVWFQFINGVTNSFIIGGESHFSCSFDVRGCKKSVKNSFFVRGNADDFCAEFSLF